MTYVDYNQYSRVRVENGHDSLMSHNFAYKISIDLGLQKLSENLRLLGL